MSVPILSQRYAIGDGVRLADVALRLVRTIVAFKPGKNRLLGARRNNPEKSL